jgi:sugar O-acyltransferase (sialic acid O-acetyltransferase NeuD family)
LAQSVVLVGAGGLGREALEAARACDGGRRWDVVGFVDDDPGVAPTVAGVAVLGPTTMLDGLDAQVLLCVAHPHRPSGRQALAARLALPASRSAVLVHPGAVLASTAHVGAGTVVLAGTIATADVEIGEHVIVMPGCVFTHDDRIGAFCTFGAGVRLAGGVTVGETAYVGSGALVREGVTIGAGAVIGMGAVVLHDVPAGEVWAGNPARRIRSLDGARGDTA